MAKVTAPLLSLSARGKFAKTMVASSWKGINVMRQYAVPANPQTAAQTTQRNLFTDQVSVWRNFFTNAVMRAGWNRLALELADTMSGFNAAMRNMLGAAAVDAASSFALSGNALAGNLVEFSLLNVDDGATGTEAGNFEIWAGSKPSSLLKSEEVAIAAGDVIGTVDLGDTDDVVYCKLVKDGFDRSGILAITLIA